MKNFINIICIIAIAYAYFNVGKYYSDPCLKCSQIEAKLIKANNTIKTLQDTLDGAIIIYKQQ